MRESALGSVFIFQKRGIGLDNYKSKESLSRVVVRLLMDMILKLMLVSRISIFQGLMNTKTH